MVSLLVPVIVSLAALPGQAQPPSKKELGHRALQSVVDFLKNDDSEVRGLAVEVLGEAGNKAASGMLRKMLQDRDKHVRIAAARSLWRIGSPAGIKTLQAIIDDVPAQGPVAVTNTPLVELKIISQNRIREKAMEAYAWMRGDKAADLLYKLKNDNYGTIRDAAGKELARLGHEDELALFLDALSDQDEAIRYNAATLFASICSKDAVAPLAKVAASGDSVRVRMAALDALACSPGKKGASPELLKLTEDDNPTIRYKAVSALGGIKDDKVLARLTAISSQDKDVRMRIAAQRALMLSGAPTDISVARDAMTAASPDVRLEALEVAASFPEDKSLPLLAAALDDPDTKVKLYGALYILRTAERK
ncbi:MAG: HEAT repeat domain-containing protein [Elusimicrobia bacterium]|nr:HEAT repeat domain-containing protein [Elusimicrobiota bacterium]